MRPFLTTLTLFALIAAALWWQQQRAVASLRAELNTPAVSTAAAAGKEAAVSPAKQKPAMPLRSVLRRADGSAVVAARSMFRGTLEMADYIRGLSRAELEALIISGSSESGDELLDPSLFALARLAELDPLAAIKHAGALARTNEDSSAFYLIMHDWLIRDRAAALKWFHAQPDTNAKAGFIGVAGMVLAGSDAELLAQLTGSIEDPDIHRKSLALSLASLSLTDPAAAIARFSELPDNESKREVLLSLMMTHGDKNPRQLLELALPLAMEPDGKQDNLGILLTQFSTGEPQAALEWFTRRTPEETARMIHDASFCMSGLGKLETAAVLAAVQNRSQADRDWLLANHYAARPLDDAPALLNEIRSSIGDQKLSTIAMHQVVDRCVRDGRESQLEPWIATQPAATQAALRAQVAKLKAEPAR